VTGAVVGVFVLFAVVGPLLLYILVRSEHDDRERMDREQAERVVRRDTDTEADPDERSHNRQQWDR
jgi:hypothetical protein